ncbi:MAG: hypothetical protein AB7F86_05115 [Bdellovibrionales bacterium]
MGTAHAVLREDVGVLRIHDLLLRPNFLLIENGTGAFSIGESSFALRWELENRFSGVIRLGPRTLLNPLARYSTTVDEDIVAVEAFAEMNHPYGRLRLGRVPVEFGYEGQQWERTLVFPRSLLFSKRAMMLRDVGGSYLIHQNNYYTGFVIHNGESDTDKDGRIWFTSRWGYANDKFEIGATGQTGSTKPTATSTSADTLAGVDPTQEALWRLGGIYGALHKKTWEWVLEYYIGEREQSTNIGKFMAGHLDISVEFTRYFSAHFRYDSYDPNLSQFGDLQRNVSLGLEWSNKTHSSNLIIMGTKVFEEKHQIPNDELRLIWSLSPSGIVRF